MADLQELREQVRILLDEQEANLFSDAEIDRQINQGAIHACRATQCLQFPFQLDTEEDRTEYACQAQTTDIIQVLYSDGSTSWKLKLMPADIAKAGSRVSSGRPTHYYVKPFISQFMEQDTSSQIVLSQLDSGKPNKYRSVVGIYPAPSNAGELITVDSFIVHPRMKKDTDECLLPDGYEDCAIYFAVFKGLLKQKFYAEAKTYQDLFSQMVDSLADYRAQDASVSHPQVRLEDYPMDDGFIDIDSRIVVD